mmetsp:Transcript_10106/g.28983  ORF Transcript_10106/g.28983 Transcript_10106/m.28983 type:complete len:293 (-) Transcript_10106:376-1254(-)
MLDGPPVEHVAQQDVVGGLVGVDEPAHRGVHLVGQDGLDHLERRRQARAAAQEAQRARPPPLAVNLELPAPRVLEVEQRAADLDRVAHGHGLEVLAHLAARREPRVGPRPVHLDDEVEVPDGVVRAGRGVGAVHHLARDGGREHDVPAQRQAQPLRGLRQRVAEAPRVVRQAVALREAHRNVLGGILQGGVGVGGRGGVGRSRGRGLVEVAHEHGLEHLARGLGVERLEVGRAVLAAVAQDGALAARVAREEGGSVVHLVVDDDPAAAFVLVLFYFVPRQLGRGFGLAGLLR